MNWIALLGSIGNLYLVCQCHPSGDFSLWKSANWVRIMIYNIKKAFFKKNFWFLVMVMRADLGGAIEWRVGMNIEKLGLGEWFEVQLGLSARLLYWRVRRSTTCIYSREIYQLGRLVRFIRKWTCCNILSILFTRYVSVCPSFTSTFFSKDRRMIMSCFQGFMSCSYCS